jgi:hypothetical protein
MDWQGAKTIGMNDSDHETGNAVIENSFNELRKQK